MSILDDFIRVSRRYRCPVCGRGDWCLLRGADPADPDAAICARVESAKRYGEAGWLHVRREGPFERRPRRCLVSSSVRRSDLAGLVDEFRGLVDPDLLHGLACELGLPVQSLRQLGIGLVPSDRLADVGIRWAAYAWSFPMVDELGDVIGVRLRLPRGRKLTIAGSNQGLFVPEGLSEASGRLFVAEGESDAAALLALGFGVIGRPGCTSCRGLVARFVQRHRPGSVIVVGDPDARGIEGAARLARALATYAPDVRLVVPPGHDIRDWVRSGARAADVMEAVENAEPTALSVVAERRSS